jgi:hypothetical protein
MKRNVNDAVALSLGLALVGANWCAAMWLLPLIVCNQRLAPARARS